MFDSLSSIPHVFLLFGFQAMLSLRDVVRVVTSLDYEPEVAEVVVLVFGAIHTE